MLRGLTATFVLVACLLGGGCGGGDSREDEVRAALTEALTSRDVAVCDERMTASYLQQYTTESTTAAARRSCRENQRSDRARSVRISDITVQGSRATAEFSTVGGVLAFRTATMALRRSDGEWRLHRVTRATLDRPQFFNAVRRSLARPPDAVPTSTIDCVQRSLKERSDEEIVSQILDGDPRYLATPALVCSVRVELVKEGLSQTQARCVARNVGRAVDAAGGRRIIDELRGDSSPLLERASRRAAERCR